MAQRILGALLVLACMTEAAANVAPTVSLGALPANVAAPAAIALSATAADSDGSVAKVEFYNGAALLATVTQAPYGFNWTGVAAGTYVITARATDNAGAQTTTVASSVTVTGGAAQVYYIYSDQVGTAKEIVNAAGAKVWQADTEPFGANPPNENPAGQGAFTYNQRFPGQYFDRESGLHHNYHRDYDPQTGRYMQSDPIGLEGGINTYGYVAGNPLSHIDPLGLAPGDRYKSANAAAIQAIRDVNARSIAEGLEYGGRICRNPDNTCTYTPPEQGNPNGLKKLPVACRPDQRNEGMYHTHGKYDPGSHRDDLFSDVDKYWGHREGNIWLGTPGHVIRVWSRGDVPNDNGKEIGKSSPDACKKCK